MSNYDKSRYDEIFRQSLQDTKEMYNSPSQPLHSSQQIPSQQFSYYDTQSSLNQSTDPSIQNPPSQSVQPTNLYLYNNGSPSIASQSLEYSSFHGEINEGDKLNLKNNFQMRKLKKAKLKRQKKAEYIDFLEQRISQLDRIIKQNNLTFVEPSQDSVKKIETSSSLDNNNALSFPKINSVSKPKLISPLATNIQSSNKNIDNLTNRIPSDNTFSPNKKQKIESLKIKKNTFKFENFRFEPYILLQRHTLDVDVTINLTNDYFELAEEFLNIPDEISCDFYENDKKKTNFKDDSLNIFNTPDDNVSMKDVSDSSYVYDKDDPYGIFSCSFCTFHMTYKALSETESFNEFVYEVIQYLFIYCSYFPPDDLVDLEILRNDLNTHNIFLINSLCAYGLALLPFDIPYNIGNLDTFLKKCSDSCPAQTLEEFYIKYIKNQQITYKQIFAMSDMFYQEALKYHFFDGPIELHTIEGYISLSLYNYLIGRLYKAWEYLGMAIRYGDAFNLNSFIDDDNFGVEKIISKRLWWKCYAFDTISIKMVDTEGFFNNTRYDKFTQNKIDYCNINEDNANPEEILRKRKNSAFLTLYKFIRIFKKVNLYYYNQLDRILNKDYYNSLNYAKPGCSFFKKVPLQKNENISSSKNINDEVEDILLDPQKELLKLELKNIWDSIPLIFKRVSLINTSMNPNILKLMATYNLFYYSIFIHLYRPKKFLKNFTWSNGLSKNSYDRMICFRSSQRVAKFLYRYYKAGIIDLIPNALLFPVFDVVTVVLSDFRAEQNLLEKRSLKINIDYYEEKKRNYLF